MSHLVRNILANLASNVWSTAISLFLTPVYVHFLGVESYGLIGFYVSWVAILGIVDTSLSTTALREMAWLSARSDEREKIPSLLRTLEVAYWIAMLTIGVALFSAAWSFGAGWFHTARLQPTTVRDALMLMVVALVVQVPAGLYVGGLMGLQRQVEASALVALFGTVRAVGAIAVLWLIAPDIRVFFLWQIVASGVQTFGTRALLLRSTRALDNQPPRYSSMLLRSVRNFAGETSVITALSLVLAQGDKIILSRFVSLESFGLYTVAWTVASGLSRVVTPLLQAFSPRFTELRSLGNIDALARQVRIASQLTNTLVLPPAALLVVAAVPLLQAWLGDDGVAAGAAPLLSVLAVGTLLSACSYPSLAILYSEPRLRPVTVVNLFAVLLLLPLCAGSIWYFGAVGASWCWALHGLLMYLTYQIIGSRGLAGAKPVASIFRDFIPPALASIGAALLTAHWATQVSGRLALAGVLASGMVVGWAAALIVCRDLGRIALDTLRGRSIETGMSV